MTTKHVIALTLISSAAAYSAHAEAAVGLKASTLGAGIDLAAAIPTSQPGTLDVRLNGNYFSYSSTKSYSSNRYDGDLKLNSVGVLLDWYPFHGSFKISGGGYYTGTKLDVTGQPTEGSFTFNGQQYSSAEVGSLTGKAKFQHETAPYVGIGWGNPFAGSNHWSVFVDLGVIFTGSPKLELSSTGGTLSNNATLQQNLEQERKKAEDDVSNISVYPVVSLGVAYRF